MPSTVDPHASAAIQPHPAALNVRSSEPLPVPTANSEAAAPVVTSADSMNGSALPTIRSVTRM
ncbi:MAG: hypothetical protein QOF26_3907 [Baekduia sp.]|nr:hypothetical protein [Baekduia sp.]